MTTSTVINRQDPAIEAYRLGLLGDTQEFIKKQIETGDLPPDYQIAGLSPAEKAASSAAKRGVGAYQPYLNQGSASLRGATGMMSQGQGYMGAGAASLAGTGAQYDPNRAKGIASTGMQQLARTGGQYNAAPTMANTYGAMQDMSQTTGSYDPRSARGYMNEYEDQAVQQALQDVARAGQMQQSQLGANAVASGAFGGARQGIAEAELGRNTLEQQGRTAAQMRQAGYESAAQRSQAAFEQAQGRGQTAAQQRAAMGLAAGQFGQGTYENALNRQQAAASAYGNLGQGLGSLGQGLGQLGIQQAGLGEMYSGLNTQDIQNLMTTGANQRGVQQAGLDALRMSNLQRYTQPYQQYGFLSDIYSGTPTGSSTLTASSAPQVSPFQTALGLGIGALGAATGAQRAGLF